MTTWVEWVEPFGDSSDPVYMRVSKETAIAHIKRVYPPNTNDKKALDEFILVHWATLREE